MVSAGSALSRAVAGAAFAVCVAVSGPAAVDPAANPPAPAAQSSPEVRALWVLRTSLASPASVDALVRSARANGFNTLFVQVRGRGDAYYAGSIEPRPPELARQPAAFDPLATVLRAAHASDLRVHAWINLNLIASAVELPASRAHLVRRHPEWLMVPRELAPELAKMDPASPAYVARLARWTRARSGALEGLYVSPVHAGAADYAAKLVDALARKYPLDGIHFDYARYPNDGFDYSRPTLRAFRAAVERQLPWKVRQTLAAREKRDATAFPDALPAEWRRFRADRLSALMARLRRVVRNARPAALVSVAVKPDIREAADDKLQEWPAWLERGIVDAVCPMAYTTEAAQFAREIAAARTAAGGRQVWAGIGAYRLSPVETAANIGTARRLGADGIILFSYDSMIDPQRRIRDYLGLVSRAAFPAADAPPGPR
jgi:uncharacterized lipoprotein YddW (UPF0748 family)